MNEQHYIHTPVFFNEILAEAEAVMAVGSSLIVDSTLGEGGHTRAILERFPDVKMISFERDPEILAIAKKRLEPYAGRVELINDNFANQGSYLEKHRGSVSLIIYDFGISSYHFDASKRGFTFRNEQPLDMRLDPGCSKTAAQIINGYTEKQLADIIHFYGEDRFSKRIASRIVEVRRETPIETTTQLEDIVFKAIPRKLHSKHIHPATRVFQALRIEVNDELKAIETALETSWSYLAPGGRIAGISFHSLEDRIMKQRFRELDKERQMVRVLTKKPILPTEEEIASNPRSRSAKLRVIERREA